MATVATRQSGAVEGSLAVAVATHGRVERPRAVARRLLALDRPGHTHLVGVDYAGSRAVYYDCLDRVALAVDLDVLADDELACGNDEVDGEAATEPLDECSTRLAALHDRPLSPWIDRWGAYWGWRHPRYR